MLRVARALTRPWPCRAGSARPAAARDLRGEVVDAAESGSTAARDPVRVDRRVNLLPQRRDARLRIAAVARGERRGDRRRLLRPGVRECTGQLRLRGLGWRDLRAAAGEPSSERDEDADPSHSPASSRTAPGALRRASRPGSARRRTARGGSVAVRASRSSTRYAARGSPSRGCPTEPGFSIQRASPRPSTVPSGDAAPSSSVAAQRDLQRDVAVADEHDRLLGQPERRERGLVRQHVLPHRVASAPVEEGDVVRCAGGSSPFEIGERPLAQHVARPRGRNARVAAELDQVDPAAHGEVVVTAEAARCPRADELAALVRPRPVADDVAEAPELVGRVGVDRGEHALERVEVRMDVGDDGDAHGYSLPTRRPASIGTVAGIVGVASSNSPHAPAARPVATAACRRRAHDDAEQRGGDEVEPAHGRAAERRVLEPRDSVTGRRREADMVQRLRRRPDLRRAPDEHDVDDREHDEAGGERPRGRALPRELGDRHARRARSARSTRPCATQSVTEPRDEPERRPRAARGAGSRRRVPASPRRRAARAHAGRPRRRAARRRRSRVRRREEQTPAQPNRPRAVAFRGTRTIAACTAHRTAYDGARLRGPAFPGRLRIPSVVWYFDQESCSAAISSSTKRGDALMRPTTAPGTSPVSTSCSMRANVSVNS